MDGEPPETGDSSRVIVVRSAPPNLGGHLLRRATMTVPWDAVAFQIRQYRKPAGSLNPMYRRF
ncbi:MAG: hypothetical protein AB7O26_11330 [Planctomycetaceae bacterium]